MDFEVHVDHFRIVTAFEPSPVGTAHYNSQLQMPVLQNCLNFDYSPCRSHWTAVRSSSEEIRRHSQNISDCGWFLLNVGRTQIYFRINIENNLENSNWSVLRNLWLFSFKTQCFLGNNIVTPAKVWLNKNININFCNTSILTVISCDG